MPSRGGQWEVSEEEFAVQEKTSEITEGQTKGKTLLVRVFFMSVLEVGKLEVQTCYSS